MNEALYALIGVFLGALLPAVATIWQAHTSAKHAERESTQARAERQADYRKALVASWRDGLAAVIAEEGHSPAHAVSLAGSDSPLYGRAWYLSLRPHLTEEARKSVEPRPNTVMVSLGGPPILFSLTDEIARIEREWGLI